jgi:hypothetical protein
MVFITVICQIDIFLIFATPFADDDLPGIFAAGPWLRSEQSDRFVDMVSHYNQYRALFFLIAKFLPVLKGFEFGPVQNQHTRQSDSANPMRQWPPHAH